MVMVQSGLNSKERDRMAYAFTIMDEHSYKIEGNGTRIVQTDMSPFVFPHPGATVEESAQNHINALITEQEAAENEKATTESQLQELMLAVAELASSSEQNKLETQLAIAELAATLNGGVA